MKKTATTNSAVKTLGLYIHIPFCKTICVYCNFLTFANKNRWIPDYIEALKREIREKAKTFKEYSVETVYFGGGTPSLIEGYFIQGLIKELRINFLLSKKVEISLEANPESLTLEKLNTYKNSGISRISLGVQSLNPKTLWKVARPHNEKATLKALQLLRDEQWENFGCDLIMGLPYQTLAEFQEHLEIILGFGPKHLSAYFLSYDTPRIDTFIKESPKEEEQVAMYQYLIRRLKKANFNHYEVSNYALPGYESQHNLRYWQRKEYLGLGLGAHSFINERVSENIRDFAKYLINPLEYEDQYDLDVETQQMDCLMLSLRTAKGLNLADYTEKYGNEAHRQLLLKSLSYTANKDLVIDKNHLQPTEKGFLILDRITKDLL